MTSEILTFRLTDETWWKGFAGARLFSEMQGCIVSGRKGERTWTRGPLLHSASVRREVLQSTEQPVKSSALYM